VNNIKWGVMAAIAAVILSVGIGLLSHVAMLHIFLRALIFAAVFFSLGFGLRFLVNTFFPELLFSDDGSSSEVSFDQPGSVVNIVIDNTGEYAVPELYKAPGDPNELGNIDDLISGVFKPRSSSDDQPQDGFSGIDRMKKESYNIGSIAKPDSVSPFGGTFPSFPDQDDFSFQETDAFEKPEVEKPMAEKPVFTPSFGDDMGVGGLPDLEMFAMAFSSGGEPRAPMQPMAPAVGVSVAEQPLDDFEPGPQPTRYASGKPTPMKGDFNPKELAKGISTVLSKEK